MHCGDSEAESITDAVKEYYGKKLVSSNDLQTNACHLNTDTMPKHIKDALHLIHPDIKNKYFGCGLVAPESLGKMCILDLGCGSGQDSYVLARLVGESGHVTGIDMTDEQLAIANQYKEYHRDKFGYRTINTEFVKGYIEDLSTAGVPDNKYDIIVSNCVFNLSPNKRAALREAHRVLKVGGEFYFSDIYADRDLPPEVRKNKVLWGECLAGALHWKEFVKLAKEVGFSKPRLFSAKKMEIKNSELQEVVGDATFVSAVYRLFKLPPVMDKPCHVKYEGTLVGQNDEFVFDATHTFKVDESTYVNSELTTILRTSRYRDEFIFEPAPKIRPVSQEEEIDPFELAKCKPSSISQPMDVDYHASSSQNGCSFEEGYGWTEDGVWRSYYEDKTYWSIFH